ncbi:MAG: ferrochelatase [Bacteroidales bacterium]|nr:ferrochelatase [Bacteroidales bacterium]
MSTALLITNYGTPASSKTSDVRKYLRQMLNNNHVMTMNSFARNILVNCIIAPFRAKKSAKLYSQLEDKRGMPLLYHTQDFVNKIQNILGNKVDVYYAMTAGTHLIKDIVPKILSKNYDKIIIVPMFPQYTESTIGNAFGDVFNIIKDSFNIPEIITCNHFYNSPHYINSMATLIKQNLGDFKYDKFIFSYHGIPISHTKSAHNNLDCKHYNCKQTINSENSKCYLAQCYQTTKLICKEAQIPQEKAFTCFQSRFSDNWLQPFTDISIKQMAKEGIKNIAIITPSFTVDCLETTIEISQTLKLDFIKNGGKEFKSIPCLNSSDFWAEDFCKIIENKLN